MEMEYDEIVAEAKSRISGNIRCLKKDSDILSEYLKKFESHSRFSDIQQEFEKILSDIVSPTLYEDFGITSSEYLKIHELLFEAQQALLDDKINECFDLFNELIKMLDSIYESKDLSDFNTFDSTMENLLFEISGKRRAKAPKQTPINFANIYNCYATFLKTIKSYDAAALYYDRSLEFNPMSTDTLFSLADLYRIQGCWEEFEEILHRVHPMAYTRKQLSKCYESYYYLAMERKQYKLASVLCHMAQRFGSEDTMQEELDELIDSKLCKVTKPSVLKMREMCKKHDIPFGHNPSIAEEAARVAAILTDKHPWAAFELFGVASELTSDPKYREEMQKLVKRIIKVVHVEHFEPRGDEEIEEFEEGEKEDEEMEEFEEGEEEDEEMEEDEE